MSEALRVVGVIEGTRFDLLPERWRSRGGYDSGSVERTGAGADYVFYNISHDRPLSVDAAYQLSRRDRCIPDGHPRGWDHDAVPEGWIRDGDFVNPLADPGPSNWVEDIPDDPLEETTMQGTGEAVADAGDPRETVVGTGGSVDRVPLPSDVVEGVDPASCSADLAAVRQFLVEVGFPSEMVVRASWAELRGYLRGRSNL